ncbi:9541_t:CDS:2, partial [Ambispora leptoticha]
INTPTTPQAQQYLMSPTTTLSPITPATNRNPYDYSSPSREYPQPSYNHNEGNDTYPPRGVALHSPTRDRANRAEQDAFYNSNRYDDLTYPPNAYPTSSDTNSDVNHGVMIDPPLTSYYSGGNNNSNQARSIGDVKGKGRNVIDAESETESYSDYTANHRDSSELDIPGVNIRRMDDSSRYSYSFHVTSSQDSLIHGIDTNQKKPSYYPPSQYSYNGENSSSGSGRNTPQYGLEFPHLPQGNQRSKEPYPAWRSDDHQIPCSKEEIEDIFLELTNKFGFQKDNMRNMYDHLMIMLDSRASRMSPAQALLTLHADYIGGENANYRKWYFASQMDVDDALHSSTRGMSQIRKQNLDDVRVGEEEWKEKMNSMSQYDRVRQLALYLLLWGEAAQVRFTAEVLCFIFKLADDYYRSPDCKAKVQPLPEGEYLRNVITPLYRFIREQGYEVIGGKFVKREKDHADTIGYDDINQLFWYPESIDRIMLQDRKTRLMALPPSQRYLNLGYVDWNRAFEKTYKEKRTWLHLAVNFTRIWIIHVVSFWYYTAYAAPFLYMDEKNLQPAVRWSVVALGGALATLFMIFGCICEFLFIPFKGTIVSGLMKRLVMLFIILIINAAPTYYIVKISKKDSTALIISLGQLGISVITTLTFSIIPSAKLFGGPSSTDRSSLPRQTFTASYPPLSSKDRAVSIALWTCVFGCKLIESYFFLSLSFKDPLKAMHGMRVLNCGDPIAGNMLCSYMPMMAIVIMFFMDLVLFFLDTYLWYVIWNTIFSVIHAFQLGMSIWTPWKYIFSMLPKRIYAKVLATNDTDDKYKPKNFVSQIWNAIVISMYREHLLSIDNVQKLLYQQATEPDGKRTLKAPDFFTSSSSSSRYFPPLSEAERRFSFFAQSLTTPIPKALPIPEMPTFTVLTPHYSEKILLSLREIIREEDRNTRVTLLEYLKQLHPIEWDNFVKDTKIVAEELTFTLRTRIWASLRSQTLYRTISGFMNYSKALKLLYRVENPDIVASYASNPERLERELSSMARRKFKFLVTMQRYSKFNKEEQENADFLLRAYPDLQIAYLEEQKPEKEGEENKIFSVLIDGHCEILPDGSRKPKYRVQLPGNPILGDGKSDNQNHAIIFYRGEYLQLVDANQDNYLEECLKIRSMLGEFEQFDSPTTSPYSPAAVPQNKNPVAIVGAREYIFSENYGVLGDVAAGKEQTFGTLTQRIMAMIGGKLHYGHPDFLNAIFMTTRGGISKAQKGLHLNEDIYAGMNAFCRGGRIKHTEYYQCGKGRDLGFGSILHFTTKIGTGMGEQMLSREYYYIGTQLPLDRFLSFYYAHPGFHINNIFIALSVQLFMVGMLFIGALASTLILCNYNPDPTAPLTPPGCYNLIPVFDWIKRSIISIFIVFFIAFLPLFLQELTEKGFIRSLTRLGKHFMSLSPFFEVFTTQIYANAIMTNLSFGGARYIATGRGFATARIPFNILYSRFAGPSIYFGMRTLIILLFVSMTMWIPHLTYFWASVIALCISPFLFNPHQFSFTEFIIDYREFLRWMSRGNSKTHANSWIAYCRVSRTMTTGYKRKRLGHPSEKLVGDVPKPSFAVIFVSEILWPFLTALLCVIAFMFVRSFDPTAPNSPNKGKSALIRVGVIAFGPILLNAAMLAGLFLISVCVGTVLSGFEKFGSYTAAIAHTWAIITLIGSFETFWYIESWNLSHAVLGMIAVSAIQRFIYKVLITIFLSREFKHDETNLAWWTGRWSGRTLGNSSIIQPFRELICKIVEMGLFATDFVLGHVLLFMLAPFILIPGMDKIHSTMLFWLRPSKQIRAPIFSIRERARRRRIVWIYGLIFLFMVGLFAGLIAGPIIYGSKVKRINLPM